MASAVEGQGSEFRTGWVTLLGATSAVSTGAAIFNYTSSYFVIPLQQDFGWSRAQIGLGATTTTLVSAMLMPLMGHLTDRLGPLKVGGAGLAVFGFTCFLLASIPGILGIYYAVLVVLALGFAASTAVTFAPLVAARFKRRRGLALGIMMSGPPILLIPGSPFLTMLIAEAGWRAGYVALGFGALLIGLPGLFVAARRARTIGRGAMDQGEGMDVADALRTPTYWKLSIGALLCTLALGGFLNQYAPLFADKGLSASAIGLLGSLFVGMILVGRTIVGYLLDQYRPPFVAMIFTLGAGMGALLLLLPHASLLSAAISLALIGCAFGAEGDIIAFFAARQFGLKRFSTIFATFSVMTAGGFGLGALLFGGLYDLNGNYEVAIYVGAALFAAAATLFGTLPAKRVH